MPQQTPNGPDDDFARERDAQAASEPESLPLIGEGRAGSDPDIRTPVDIDTVQPEEVQAQTREAVRFACSLLTSVDPFELQKLTDEVIEMVLDGSCRDGLSVAELAQRSRTGRGRFDERLTEDFNLAGELVVRAIAARSGRRALYEQYSSQWVRVGRRHNGLGTDKCPNRPNTLHMLVAAESRSDRHCPNAAAPFTACTRWDETCDRADEQLIADHARERRSGSEKAPGSAAENVVALLGRQDKVRAVARQAVLERPELFSEELTPRRFGQSFAGYLVIGELRAGPSSSLHRAASEILLPGRDEALVAAVADSGRMGVTFCGSPNPEEQAAMSSDFRTLPVGRLPATYELGITRLNNVIYRYSPARQMLARIVVGAGAQAELWKLSGFADHALLAAVALVERYRQVAMPSECLKRWEGDCAPGLMKAHSDVSRAGCTTLLNIANAAIVAAHRLPRGEAQQR